MKLKKILSIVLTVVVIETVAFILIIFGGEPDPSVSIGLIVIASFLFGFNIILALLFYTRKSKQIAIIMFANSIASPLIFYFIWISWYSKFDDRSYSQYSFDIGSSKFEISLSKTSNDFSIADVTSQHDSGITTELYYGKYQIKADCILIMSYEHKMFILNGKLFNFPRDSSEIDLHP